VLTGTIAAIVDCIAGSGGLITVPVLLVMGVSPIYALGTNKLQEPVGQIIATRRFFRTGELSWAFIATIAACSVVGVSLGVVLVQSLHEALLQKILPILLMLIIIYSISSKGLLSSQLHSKLTITSFSFIFGFGVGFYNGFFGPGTGLLWTAAFIYFLAMDVRLATMYAKPANLCCNMIALVWFLLHGTVLYKAAGALMIGGVAGSCVGSHLVIKKGKRVVKPFFIVMTLLLTTDLFIKAMH